jgi:hypothetical protein
MNEQPASVSETTCRDVRDQAEMAADGTITMYYKPPPVARTEVVPPGHINYELIRAIIGDIRPGEKKTLPPRAGTAHMASDGTITATFAGDYSEDLIAEPYSTTLKPGQAGYDEFIRRVGGMEPDQFKAIPLTDPDNCR